MERGLAGGKWKWTDGRAVSSLRQLRSSGDLMVRVRRAAAQGGGAVQIAAAAWKRVAVVRCDGWCSGGGAADGIAAAVGQPAAMAGGMGGDGRPGAAAGGKGQATPGWTEADLV